MRKETLAIGIIILTIGVILIPISRIPETRRVYTDQTQVVADSSCPPPVIVYLENGNYHIAVIQGEHGIWGQDALVVIHDQNGDVIFQSSLLPWSSFYQFDFVVPSSGVHNITLEDIGGFSVKVTTTKRIWNDTIAYPFESLFNTGLILTIMGVSVLAVYSVTRKRKN